MYAYSTTPHKMNLGFSGDVNMYKHELKRHIHCHLYFIMFLREQMSRKKLIHRVEGGEMVISDRPPEGDIWQDKAEWHSKGHNTGLYFNLSSYNRFFVIIK